MPRTLDPALESALDTQSGDAYFLCTITNSVTSAVTFSGQATGYKLKPLELTITVETDSYIDVSADDRLVLSRGLILSGVTYAVDTSSFYIIDSYWTGSFQTFNCHLVPVKYYTASGYDTYENVISAFCTNFGKTAVFKDPAAAWLAYKFFPSGRSIAVNNAHKFFNLLRQKYFIFACDNGNDEILFYTAYDVNTTADDEADASHWEIDREDSVQRRFIWRDENGTVHGSDPSFYQLVQFSTDPYPVGDIIRLDDDSIITIDGFRSIYKSTDNAVTWNTILLPVNPGGSMIAIRDCGNGVLVLLLTNDAVIYRSSDYGETWTNITTLFVGTASDMTTDGTNVWVWGNTKVYKSTDQGLTWDAGTTIDANMQTQDDIFHVSGSILLGSGRLNPTPPNVATWRSTDGGANWSRVSTTVKLVNFFMIGTDIYGIDSYTGTGTYYIYKSTDNGATWALFANDNAFERVVLISDTHWIAYYGDSFYESTDSGVTWSNLVIGGGTASLNDGIYLEDKKILLSYFLIGAGKPELYIFDAANVQEYPTHNLGYLESTATAPNRNTAPNAPQFDPFPIHLKYLTGDHVTINLLPTAETYEVRRAEVTEELNLNADYIPWRVYIIPTEWLSTTEAGTLPGTIEQAAPYTPLVTIGFNNNLDSSVNNLQSFADRVDDLILASFDDTEGDPADVAGSAADGTSVYSARRDHVHKGATATHTHTGLVTNGDSHDHAGGDGAAIPTGGIASKAITLTKLADLSLLPGGRLTLTTGTPITTNDVTAATTIYYTPSIHNIIVLWDGSNWTPITFTEISLALGSITSELPYDVFSYLSSGALAIEKLAWTNTTTRATAITLQDGRYCKSGDKTRLYLGTFYTTSTTTTEDSEAKRFIFNMYNRHPRPLSLIDTTDSWSYTTDTTRQARATASNKVEFILGISEDAVRATAKGTVYVLSNSLKAAKVGVGLDTTTAFSGLVQGGYNSAATGLYTQANGEYIGIPSVGYHYLSWNEKGADGTCVFLGDNAGDGQQSGLKGEVWA
jgi:photosystem II stability/assembly factor-like uncharacterized protein